MENAGLDLLVPEELVHAGHETVACVLEAAVGGEAQLVADSASTDMAGVTRDCHRTSAWQTHSKRLSPLLSEELDPVAGPLVWLWRPPDCVVDDEAKLATLRLLRTEREIASNHITSGVAAVVVAEGDPRGMAG